MRREERKIAWAMGAAFVAAPVGLVGLMIGLYFFGLSLVPETPRQAAAVPVPAVIADAIWARFDGGAPQVEAMTPWAFVQLRACRALASRADDREAAREACIRKHPGVEVAGAVATDHVVGHGLTRSLRGEIGQVATAAWLTRHWSRADLLGQLAETGDFGHGWHGVRAAARGYFGKDADTLTATEAALLAAVLGRTSVADPWCHPDRSLSERNHVLDRMALAGSLPRDAPAELSGQPLGVGAGECPPARP